MLATILPHFFSAESCQTTYTVSEVGIIIYLFRSTSLFFSYKVLTKADTWLNTQRGLLLYTSCSCHISFIIKLFLPKCKINSNSAYSTYLLTAVTRALLFLLTSS